jgi:two-component system OmpR family response regulator
VTIHKVMLVDDEPDIRKLGQLSLSAIGKWQVLLCSDGAVAAALAAREMPDVILLDVMMPHTDGPATLALLRANAATRHIPIIFLTATSEPAELRKLLALGACGLINKPFAPMGLPKQVAELVAKVGR